MSTLPPRLQQWKQELHRSPTPDKAMAIITDFFQHRPLPEVKEELWALTVASLTTPEDSLAQTAIDRHNRLFFYEHCLLLLEAVDILQGKTPNSLINAQKIP